MRALSKWLPRKNERTCLLAEFNRTNSITIPSLPLSLTSTRLHTVRPMNTPHSHEMCGAQVCRAAAACCLCARVNGSTRLKYFGEFEFKWFQLHLQFPCYSLHAITQQYRTMSSFILERPAYANAAIWFYIHTVCASRCFLFGLNAVCTGVCLNAYRVIPRRHTHTHTPKHTETHRDIRRNETTNWLAERTCLGNQYWSSA